MVGNAASILQRQNGARIDALAGAIEHALDHPPAAASLRARAQRFSVEKSADAYLELLLPTQP